MLSLGFSFSEAENVLNNYGFETIREVVKQVEKQENIKRAVFKNDLLSIVKGVRLAFASLYGKKGVSAYSKYIKNEEKYIKKLLGVKDNFTVWDNLSKSARI